MKIQTLDELCQELHKVFESDEVNVDYVQAIMTAYKSNPADWQKYAKFDRNARYTRNLVDAGNGKFNLMILCWNESQGSCIHDHADAHCFMKLLHGELTEIRFAWPTDVPEEEGKEVLPETGRSAMRTNEVCYINDSLGLHRVENQSHSEKAISLHLYCPPYNSCHMFDQRTGQKTKCKVTFWSKYGERTPYINADLIPSVSH